jgi:signal transduction histidine kinase/ligand-binding sensor domain-containing protein/DNA-binding NarL/FixJ family response regulator
MKKPVYLLICSLICLPALHAKDINFSQISSANGLSQNTVRAIAVDKNGFVWAGTLDGLNRYDGYNIRSYQMKNGNANIFSDHRIRNLYIAESGNLWMQTYRNEYSCYDPLTDSFTHLKDEEGRLLMYEFFHESARGDVWLWGNGAVRVGRDAENRFVNTFFHEDSERCNFLFEDSSGAIWIGTTNGLKKVAGDTTENHYSNTCCFTQAVELGGKVYFSTLESGLLIYDIRQKAFDDAGAAFDDPLTNLFRFSPHELLLFSKSKGVWVYDIPARRFRRSELNADAHFSVNVRMVSDRKGGVWFYDQSGILWYCNGEDGKVRKKHLIPEEALRLTDNALRSFSIDGILVDSQGLCWVNTYGYGLFCYDPADESWSNYRNQPGQNSLASDYLLSITEDTYGNIWIGSEYAGLIRLVKNPEYVSFLRPQAGSEIGKDNNVRSICEDSRGYIWLGLKNSNLYVYNPSLSEGRCIGKDLNPYALIEDRHGRMWVGTKSSGIYLYDINTFKETAHFRHEDNDPASLPNNVIFHIMKDTKDRMWIAGFDGGGVMLAEETGGGIRFRSFFTNEGNRSMVRYLYQDKSGMIWAGTSEGLLRFDPDQLIRNPAAYVCHTMDIDRPNSLSSNDIKTICQDSEGVVWIGTAGGGLNKYVEATADAPEQFLSFTINEGMPDNYVLGILEHGADLWLSSESGLSCFNKTDYSVMTYLFAQKSYGNIFNEGAHVKRRDGTMLWGNLDGLMVFDPVKFSPDTNVPPILLTGLQIDGTDWTSVASSSGKAITYTDHIRLNYRQNILTMEFATLNLRNPDKNRYTYILENYDRTWSAPSHTNKVTYKNLPPGKYTFKVKGSNSYGIWNEGQTTLSVTIAPPFWKSSPAYAAYFMLVAGLLYIAFRLIMKFNRLNNAVEVEKQFTNHKLRFFTNISHEFRTPLTLIQGAVENLNELPGLPATAQKQLKVLNRNSVNLGRLIDQLLEFRKLQNDVLKLDLEEVDIIAFAHDIYSGFQELAAQKAIGYRFISPAEVQPLFIDRKKVDKILYNLLSNAFKFTPKGGSIELSLATDEKNRKCLISVKDSGAGVPKEKQHLLFSRFSQIHFSGSGTGVGLSLVKEFTDVHKGKASYEDNPGGGAIFRVELSTDRNTYEGENFIAAQPQPDIIREEEQAPPAGPEHEETDAGRGVFARYRLLIIDDNNDICDFLSDGFRGKLAVDTAVDGHEGLQKAIETNPDLIICDVMMPGMDGFEVTRQLKNEFQTCHIPIILLTAHSSDEHRMEGIDSGADAYIVKPFSLKYVQKRVMKLIEQREQLKKRFSKEFVIDGNLINSTDRDKQFFRKIEKILDERYADSAFTIDSFAELSGVRRTVFFKKVKGITGFSPNELIKMKRLNRSAVLLKQGDLTVSEISYQVGFDDPYYFSKCFKSHFNCTPSSYRKGEGAAG